MKKKIMLRGAAILAALVTINISHADNIWTCFSPGNSDYKSNKEGTEGTYINGTDADSENPDWECDGQDNKWSIGPWDTHSYDVVCYGDWEENFAPDKFTVDCSDPNIDVSYIEEEYTTNSSDANTGSKTYFTATNWADSTKHIKLENIICHGDTDSDTLHGDGLPNTSIDHSGCDSISDWTLWNYAAVSQ